MNNSKGQYWIFIIITILYFLILNQFFDVNIAKVKALPVNELGDFLAGTFSPLAFLFLILGYLQTNKSLGQNSEAIAQQAIALQQQAKSLQMQSDELKISNQALQAQAIELRNSVEQQKNLLEVTRSELEIKHLEAEPYLTFKSYNFDIDMKEFVQYDDDTGLVIDSDCLEVAIIQLTIENQGELAKLISIKEISPKWCDFEWNISEIQKNIKKTLSYNVMGEELELLKQTLKQDVQLEIIFHDKYTRQYNERINMSISPARDCSGSFSVYITKISV